MDSVLQWAPLIKKMAMKFGIAPSLVAGIMEIESQGKQDAVSRAGATGLMQVMPFHFNWLQSPFDPATNLYVACRLLHELYTRYGRWDYAIAAYNGAFRAPSYILDEGYDYILAVFNAQQNYWRLNA